MLAAQAQAEPAFELTGAADALREAIGSPGRGPRGRFERLLAEVRTGQPRLHGGAGQVWRPAASQWRWPRVHQIGRDWHSPM